MCTQACLRACMPRRPPSKPAHGLEIGTKGWGSKRCVTRPRYLRFSILKEYRFYRILPLTTHTAPASRCHNYDPHTQWNKPFPLYGTYLETSSTTRKDPKLPAPGQSIHSRSGSTWPGGMTTKTRRRSRVTKGSLLRCWAQLTSTPTTK